jgi:MYXO-CTERM domain-containing protein
MNWVSVRPSLRPVRALVALAVLASLLLVPAAARAGGTLDQTSPASNASFNVGMSNLVWQQQIKAGLAGRLAGISVTLAGGTVGGTITVGIRMGAAPSTQPVLAQHVATYTGPANQPQQVLVDFSADNVPLSVGTIFVMEISGGSGLSMTGSYVAPPGMPMYSQPLYINGAVQGDGGWRLGFQTYVYTCTPGMACDDGDPCTTNDVCDASYNCAGTPVVCKAMDACHTAGTCEPTTGTCSNPTAPDGATCDDGDACTQTDKCMSGTCVGSNPVTCSAAPVCQMANPCDPMTGTCTYTPEPDGTMCSGGTCRNGTCQPTMMGTGGSTSASSSGGVGGGMTTGTGTGGSTGTTTSGGTGAGSTGPSAQGHCGCRTAGDPPAGTPLALLLTLGAAARRRRRRG